MKRQTLLFLFTIIFYPTVFSQSVQKVWGKKFMSPNFESLQFTTQKAIADNQGNIIIGGESADSLSNTPAIRLMKLDSSGAILWQFTHLHYKTINRSTRLHNATSNWVSTLTVDASNNIYVAYSTDDSIAGAFALRWCVMKISSAGNILWDKMYTGQYGDAAYPIAVKVDGNGDVYVTGMGNNTGINDNAMVTIKLNSSGVLQWDRMIDGNAVDNGNTTSVGMDLVIDNSSNIYVTGHLANYDSVHHFDLVLAKYSSAGNLLWSKVIDDTSGVRWQMGQRVFLNSNSELIVCGYNSSFYQNFFNDILLMKFNSAGDVVWKKTFKENIDEVLQDMVLDNSGNIIVASKMQSIWGQLGYYGQLLKFNGANGDTLWTYSTAQVTDWLPTGVAIGSSGAVYAWGVEAFNLPYSQGRLITLSSAGNVISSLNDSTINQQFSSLQSQNIISVNNALYGIAHFINQTNSVINGLLVKFSLGIAVSANEVSIERLKAFPNPFHRQIAFYSPDDAISKIEVTDATGRVLYKEYPQSNSAAINTEAWNRGLYFVMASSAEKTEVIKAIKAK